jgi:cysteinyl-tRNA synthetase
MKNVFGNILGCIGNTPLVRINRLNPNPRVTVYAKLEMKNPGGSIKDRAALSMIEAAEKSGELTARKTIIEATSGNTGIGLAMVAAVKGYRIVLAMPETASMERQKILKALGAELLLTPGNLGTDGAIEEVYRLVRENPDRYYMPDQFNNPANPGAHYHGTGPEIYEQTDGKVNVVVATLGTGGTAMGLVRSLKERDPAIQVVGVEPYPSHKIQGLKNMKESYVPGIFDRHALDSVMHVKDEEAFETARRLAREEGIFVGMSSGAAMAVALKIAQERTDGIVVTVLPDGGDRYLSTNLFTTMMEPDFRFFDHLSRAKKDFKPVQEGKVRIFITGSPLDQSLTLQASRRFVLADLLVRFLMTKGFQTESAVLIPDLDSRTIHGAIQAGSKLEEYAAAREAALLKEMDSLGIRRPTCARISDHVSAMVDYARELLKKGYAYEKLRSVYYALSEFPRYGELARIDPRKTRAGSTVDLEAYEKLNPRDFTLLKRATLAELKRGFYVKTEWGNVLPTWHIAAASIAISQLGSPLDLCVSSTDFLFPHLENVRAIAEAITGKPYANTWMLAERVTTAWEPESGGPRENVLLEDVLSRGFEPMAIRFWLLSSHYRKPLHLSDAALNNAARGYRRLRECINRLQHARENHEDHPTLAEMLFTMEQNFFDALADDLNTPQAFAALFRFVRRLNPILESEAISRTQRDQVLEVFQKINSVLGLFDLELQPLSEEEERLLSARESARREKRWDEADRLREALRRRGIAVVDTPHGPRWERLR